MNIASTLWKVNEIFFIRYDNLTTNITNFT